MESRKKPRIDGQLTALAGEFFVAGELLKRGLQTSVTFGNAKAIDLFAYNSKSTRAFNVQVKALRKPNYFPISPEKVCADYIYVFVLLNEPGTPVEYFVVPGKELVSHKAQFGKSYKPSNFPCIHLKNLESFRDGWSVFEDAKKIIAVNKTASAAGSLGAIPAGDLASRRPNVDHPKLPHITR
jgi:hypothetical protein